MQSPATDEVVGQRREARRAAIAAADRLHEEGKSREAIVLLTALNRQAAHPDLEGRILDLRIEAFERSKWPAPDVAWPPAHDGRFDGVAGLPEVELGQLDVDSLKAGLLGRGGLIVRGLMDSDRAAAMRDNIDRAILGRYEHAHEEAAQSRWYRRSESVSVKGGPAIFNSQSEGFTKAGVVWTVDSPRSAFELTEFYEEIGLPEILEAYFAEPAMLSVRKWVLRCIAPANGSVAGWHQDGRFMGDNIRTVNLWIALTDCGGDADAPGMDIVASGDRAICETGTEGAPFDWTVGQGIVDKLGDDTPVVCPRFEPGDAIFFDHFNLHRTSFGTDHVNNRYALENWFFAASRAPSKQMPVIF